MKSLIVLVLVALTGCASQRPALVSQDLAGTRSCYADQGGEVCFNQSYKNNNGVNPNLYGHPRTYRSW
jgi:hypothetical protein